MSEVEEKVLKVEADDMVVRVDAEMFREFFGLASALIMSEVQMDLKTDGVYIRQMEESHVGLTDMFVPKEYFEVLKAGKVVKELRLAVDEINNILKRLSHGDVIEFTVRKGGKLHVEIQGKRVRAFNIPLLEPEKLERRLPKVPMAVRIKTTLEGLLMAIEDARTLVIKGGGSRKKKNLYGQITMMTTPMGLLIRSESEDGLRSAESTLHSGWDIMAFEGSANEKVTVSIPYMIDIVKAISRVTNMVQIEFSTDMPLHIITELPFKGVKLEFWLAPRVLKTEEKEVK